MADDKAVDATLAKLREDAKARGMLELTVAYGWSLMRYKFGEAFTLGFMRSLQGG